MSAIASFPGVSLGSVILPIGGGKPIDSFLTDGELWTVGEVWPTSSTLKPKLSGHDTWNPLLLGEGKSKSASVGLCNVELKALGAARAFEGPRISWSASLDMLSVEPAKVLDNKLPESCLTREYSTASFVSSPFSLKRNLIGLILLGSAGEGTLGVRSLRVRFDFLVEELLIVLARFLDD